MKTLRLHAPFSAWHTRSQTISTRLWLWLLTLLLMIVSAAPANAQAVNKHKLTASYLYNFAKNIEWPNEQAMTSFDIGLYGSVDPQLAAELTLLANTVKLRKLPITVQQASIDEPLDRFSLIYIDRVDDARLSKLYDETEGKPILLVTAEYANKQLVMINLISADGRMGFEVNNSNIINHGLKPLPELILNGGTEIDVAKLYREGQASLVALQKQLQGREAVLNRLTAAVDAQKISNAELENELVELNHSIQKSDVLIADQKNQLKQQHQEIEKSKSERLGLLAEMALRTKELDQQQQLLNVISQEINQREQRLAELNSTITRQETELLKQKEAIVGLDELVNSQKAALQYLWGSVILGVLLIATILIAYIIKRRDNQRLAAHSQDIQIAKDRLAIAKRKAEDASQAKSDFLSLMSHELRTPLQAIIGYTEVVIEELKLDDDQHHINDLTRVINNSERLLKLINGVLDMAKIESGRMQLDLTEVKLSSLVDEAIGSIRPLLEKNSIQLNIDVDDGAVLPIVDPEKLLHILINLLGNASKYAPNSLVTINAIHESKRIYISIADTGIGLSPQQQLHIFEPFQQADNSTTRKFQGSGLGLSITRQLCEMMGGTITVESELGKGATFIVNLPLPIEPHIFGGSSVDANAGIEISNPAGKIDGQHIVMIDDDPAFLDIMARTMRSEGYQVHTASDAETGFRLIQSIKPQIITLDLLLPDQHGWLVFEKIKAEPDLQDIPIIIISIMDERKHDPKRNAEGYLTKPIRREALRLAVQRLAPIKTSQ